MMYVLHQLCHVILSTLIIKNLNKNTHTKGGGHVHSSFDKIIKGWQINNLNSFHSVKLCVYVVYDIR